jgi:hypothetical protein
MPPVLKGGGGIRTPPMKQNHDSFNVHGSLHRKYIPIYIQQDTTLHILFISGNCCICFGWYHHPSSGEHTTVSTASGICHTVTATCRYRGRGETALQFQLFHDSGWEHWRYHRKHVDQFPDINKLCNVASCWIYIGIKSRFLLAVQ